MMNENEQLKKQLEEANAALKKAEQSTKMKSLFLANMSHEIRTPLNAINGFSKIIAYENDPQIRESYLEIIESNSQRLLDLVNDILDLSKIESGHITLKIQPMNVSEMLHEVYNVQKLHCGSLNLTVDEGDTDLYINCDRSRLIQVLSNLISNAIKHTEAGEIRVKYVQEADDTLHFTVQDTGHGIPANMLEDIFKEYVMAHSNVQGTGLGLPLCHNIVEMLGGRIWAESVQGSGSTFHFTIPTRKEKPGEFQKTVSSPNPASLFENKEAATGERKYRILIAEDNASNRELMKALLSKTYDIIWAVDGIEAVTKADEEKPELILMDIQMPNMDGLEATGIIHQVNPALPIVACSAYAFEEDKAKAREAGCVDFISKPVRGADLKQIINKYLNQ